MPSVALLGTLDTKGREYAFLRARLAELGIDTLVIDAGVAEPVGLEPDIDRRTLAAAGGAMLYVVFGEMIPQSVVMTKSRSATIVALFGLLIGLIITQI